MNEVSLGSAYKGKRIIVAGATGFVGKVWLAMVLRNLDEIGHLYLLVRSGRQPAASRMDTLFIENQVFQDIRTKYKTQLSDFLEKKVTVIPCDLNLADCGIGEGEVDLDAIDMVVNFSGLTDFDPDPSNAFEVNLKGALNLQTLASKTGGQKLLHMSTCYTAGIRDGFVKEKVSETEAPNGKKLDPYAVYENVIKVCQEHSSIKRRKNEIRDMALSLGWPNIYTFSKGLAEKILTANNRVQTSIIRPSIIECSAYFPFAGWNEGIKTAAPIVAMMRSIDPRVPAKGSNIFDVVPVDLVARACIIIGKALFEGRSKLVYHCASSHKNPLTFDDATKLVHIAFNKSDGYSGFGKLGKYLYKSNEYCTNRTYDQTSSLLQSLNRGLSKVKPVLEKNENFKLISDRIPVVNRALKSTEKISKIAEKVQKTYMSFKPFIYDHNYIFVTNNLLEESNRLNHQDENRFGFVVEKICWRNYWINIQVPGLEKWSFPIIEGKSIGADLEVPYGDDRVLFRSEQRKKLGLVSKLNVDKNSLKQINSDLALIELMKVQVLKAKNRKVSNKYARGKPLKILLVGYNGSRNTGADARVEELIRQLRHILGDKNIELSIFTLNEELTQGYFKTVSQIKLPKFFHIKLDKEIQKNHMVVVCEGSMFKSKFANALTVMNAGALALATAQGKLAVAYGGEAGEMDEVLKPLVKEGCKDALIITRNKNSSEVLKKLGIDSKVATDTAWTFESDPIDVGRNILRSKGWQDGQHILALCPINPFFWPVKPNIPKLLAKPFNSSLKASHYSSIYFHKSDRDIPFKLDRYLDDIARAALRFTQNRDIHIIVVGSEMLDREPCEILSSKLGNVPKYISDEYDMYQLISILRNAEYMISSRYHAILTSMQAKVLSIGLSMDERIPNLMKDRNNENLSHHIDSDDIETRLFKSLEYVEKNKDLVRQNIDDCIVNNLHLMGKMGKDLMTYVEEKLPEFPINQELVHSNDFLEFLPPVSTNVANSLKLRDRRDTVFGAGFYQ